MEGSGDEEQEVLTLNLSELARTQGYVRIAAVDFGATHFAYWVGRLSLTDERNADGSLVTSERIAIHHPAHAPEANNGRGGKMWRERVLRRLLVSDPFLARVDVFDAELQNPMSARPGGGAARIAGNPVAYGMSRAFLMHVRDENAHRARPRLVYSTHGTQKFTTFGVPRPVHEKDATKKYRRKRASSCFARAYINSYRSERRVLAAEFEAHQKKDDDLGDVLWAGLSRAVRIRREWLKRRQAQDRRRRTTAATEDIVLRLA